LYTDVVGPKNKNRHAIEENLDILRWLGKPFQPLEFPVRFPDVDFKALQTQPLVVFAPCSRHAAKNWPAERFAEMGRLLELPVVLVGAPDDAATCQSIADGIGAAAVNMAGKTTLLELGGILQSADLVVTVDSGPMHIAAATGTPCLAIFGPTDPVRVGPYGPQHRVVRDLSLGPADGNYSKSDLESIRKISVEQVVDAVREMLSEK
ncbi:MAG: glycosyltransferase family 9 protein, partial [Kiritimatiellales bacterium]|nr:glycosyltransferase family 9 protein [Kiritimatiellales bacterium]